MDIEKLELIGVFQKRYPEWINPELLSVKFCRSSEMVFLETFFTNDPQKVIITDLNFIGNDTLDGELFLPEIDIVDNAQVFVEFEPYSLYMCVDGLFTKEAEEIINKKVNS